MAFAVAMAAVFAIAAPARAEGCMGPCWGKDTRADAPYTAGAGSALFFADGEYMYVTDWNKDGAGVRVHFSVNYGAWQERTNTNGAHNQTLYNLSYGENLSFRFFVCLSNNGTNLAGTCSTMVYAHT